VTRQSTAPRTPPEFTTRFGGAQEGRQNSLGKIAPAKKTTLNREKLAIERGKDSVILISK